jgi:hypothetical protein
MIVDHRSTPTIPGVIRSRRTRSTKTSSNPYDGANTSSTHHRRSDPGEDGKLEYCEARREKLLLSILEETSDVQQTEPDTHMSIMTPSVYTHPGDDRVRLWCSIYHCQPWM